MNGYYFVVTIYKNGRCGYSEERYGTEQAAEIRAALQRRKPNVRHSYVCYQYTMSDVDIKKFV